MRWKRFQAVLRILLAVCVLGWTLLFLLQNGRNLLLIGPVDSGDIMLALGAVVLLTLIVLGNGRIVRAAKGWERGLALTAALALEGLALLTLLFFVALFRTGPAYIPLYGSSGEVELVVREENWLYRSNGRFYRPAGLWWIQDTGVMYEAHDIRPFGCGLYKVEWSEDQAVIQLDTGAGAWKTCVVPLR